MTLTVKTLGANRHHLALLKEAYEQVLVPAFPIQGQLDSLETLSDALKGRDPAIRTIINVMGEHLDDPARRIVKGVAVAHYYRRHNVGLLAYNAVDPRHREKGLGKVLVDSRIQALKAEAKRHGRTLGGAFIDVNDPDKVAAETDAIDPRTRVAIFEKLGARRTGIDYFEPPQTPGGRHCHSLMLMSYPVDGMHAGRAAVAGLVQGIYEQVMTPAAAAADPMLAAMRTAITAWSGAVEAPAGEPGYRLGLPDYTARRGLSPAERAGYLLHGFRTLLQRGGASAPGPR